MWQQLPHSCVPLLPDAWSNSITLLHPETIVACFCIWWYLFTKFLLNYFLPVIVHFMAPKIMRQRYAIFFKIFGSQNDVYLSATPSTKCWSILQLKNNQAYHERMQDIQLEGGVALWKISHAHLCRVHWLM